ncbi:MAG: RNase adapter RapZ [Acidimicrobiia bacterium]|nr:RNase adapter RapZ [Acidimicrobiia bacterium]
MAEIVLITGLSGAGRSGTANVLEDLGWNVIDNLPTALVGKIVELAAIPGSAVDRLALVAGRQHGDILPNVTAIRAEGHDLTVLFLDASSSELVKRYDATRRRHPMAEDAEGLIEAIELERAVLEPVREAADLVIDTTGLNVHELRERVTVAFDAVQSEQMQLAVESFGYKHGLPLDADIVMDVRFLPNPHWVDELRPLTGHDPVVRDYVLNRDQTREFLERFSQLVLVLLPSYRAEGRNYLTVAVGCTGGRHRSVAIVAELADRLRTSGITVRATHRDVAR